MALWVCAGCTCRYSVGAARCPECCSTDYRGDHEDGDEMAKIHEGRPPTYAEDIPTDEPVVRVEVDGVDQGPGEVSEAVGGPFKPLPEAVEGDTTERVSEPDYDSWSAAELREACRGRGLPSGGGGHACIKRLREHDAAKAAAEQGDEVT